MAQDTQTVLVALDTLQKRQEHMPRAIRTFELDHADGKTALVVLRTLLQTQDLVLDEQANTLRMNDTIVQLELAERIIDRIDRERGDGGDSALPLLWIGSVFIQDLGWMGEDVPRLETNPGQTVTWAKTPGVAYEIYEALGKSTGLQFLFDRDVDLYRSASLEMRDLSVQAALDAANEELGNFSVAWGPRTVFVAPDVDWRRMKDEHAAIGFFYLSHANPTDVVTMLRSSLQSRQIAVVPRLNAVLLLENMAKLATAEELIAAMDQPDSGADPGAGTPKGLAATAASEQAPIQEDPWVGKSRAEVTELLGKPSKAKRAGGGEKLTYKFLRLDPWAPAKLDVRMISVPGIGVVAQATKIDTGGVSTHVGPTEVDEQGRPVHDGPGMTETHSMEYDPKTGRLERSDLQSSTAKGKVKLRLTLGANGRVTEWSVSGGK